jgi:thiol-disulfide isomerase/thioredoxin
MSIRILTPRRAIGVLLSAALAVQGCGPASGPQPSQDRYQAAIPPTTDAGDNVTLKILDYAGLEQLIASKHGKVVVLDAWSTGCPPCMKSFPDLVALQRKIGPERLACISLSLDYEGIGKPEEAVSAPLAFLRKQYATFDNVLSSEEPEAMYKKLGITSIPAVFVYDSSGTLRKKFTEGAGSKEKPLYEQVEAVVVQLLGESK